MPARNGQFEYPNEPWTAQYAKAPPGALEGIGRSWQELMGAKKKKETKASRMTQPADASEEMHKDFSTLPEDWAAIERTEDGLRVRRGYG